MKLCYCWDFITGWEEKCKAGMEGDKADTFEKSSSQ